MINKCFKAVLTLIIGWKTALGPLEGPKTRYLLVGKSIKEKKRYLKVKLNKTLRIDNRCNLNVKEYKHYFIYIDLTNRKGRPFRVKVVINNGSAVNLIQP